MSRTFAIAAIVALSSLAARAETLSEQVHTAAVKSCAVEASASLPVSHYSAITRSCVDRVSAVAMRKITAEADAKTRASTASLASN